MAAKDTIEGIFAILTSLLKGAELLLIQHCSSNWFR